MEFDWRQEVSKELVKARMIDKFLYYMEEYATNEQIEYRDKVTKEVEAMSDQDILDDLILYISMNAAAEARSDD